MLRQKGHLGTNLITNSTNSFFLLFLAFHRPLAFKFAALLITLNTVTMYALDYTDSVSNYCVQDTMAHHGVCGLLWCKKKLFETQSLLNELFSVAGNWSGFSGGGRGGEGKKKKQAISLPLVPAWVSNQNIRILFLLPACKTTHTKFHLLRRMSTTLGLFYCSSSQTSLNYEVALHIHLAFGLLVFSLSLLASYLFSFPLLLSV